MSVNPNSPTQVLSKLQVELKSFEFINDAGAYLNQHGAGYMAGLSRAIKLLEDLKRDMDLQDAPLSTPAKPTPLEHTVESCIARLQGAHDRSTERVLALSIQTELMGALQLERKRRAVFHGG